MIKTVKSYAKPMDVVIYGGHGGGEGSSDIMITDDESGFDIISGKKTYNMSCDGFVNIYTLEGFVYVYKRALEDQMDVEDFFGISDAILLTGFVGNIDVTAFDENDKEFNFKLNDYIHHQAKDGCYDVRVILPEGTNFTRIDDKNINAFLRDSKIDAIIK